jgi:alanine dehydrogenase
LGRMGLGGACRDDHALAAGVNTRDGHVTCAPVADSQRLEFTPLEQLL